MLTMDYRMVDILNSNQLEEGDLIGLDNEVVQIISISSLPNGFSIVYENDFNEKETIEIGDDEQFEFFILE